MRRREFIAGLGSAAAWPMVLRAQQTAVPVVGYLSGRSSESDVSMLIAIRTLGQNTGGKRANTTVGAITGGTGKFTGMKGTIRGSSTSDPRAGLNETQVEIEYWFEK
jgi:hypothetical protein